MNRAAGGNHFAELFRRRLACDSGVPRPGEHDVGMRAAGVGDGHGNAAAAERRASAAPRLLQPPMALVVFSEVEGRTEPPGLAKSALFDDVLKDQRTTRAQSVSPPSLTLPSQDRARSRGRRAAGHIGAWARWVIGRDEHDAAAAMVSRIHRQQLRRQLVECLDQFRARECGCHDVTGCLAFNSSGGMP